MKSINPYINFNGNCEEAFEFYQSIFGGVPQLVRFKDMKNILGTEGMSEEKLNKIANVALPIGANTMLLGDDGADVFGQGVKPGDMYTIEIEPESAEEAERLFNVLSKGGDVEMPLEETEWAEKFGKCTDKHGVSWMFSYTGNVEVSEK